MAEGFDVVCEDHDNFLMKWMKELSEGVKYLFWPRIHETPEGQNLAGVQRNKTNTPESDGGAVSAENALKSFDQDHQASVFLAPYKYHQGQHGEACVPDDDDKKKCFDADASTYIKHVSRGHSVSEGSKVDVASDIVFGLGQVIEAPKSFARLHQNDDHTEENDPLGDSEFFATYKNLRNTDYRTTHTNAKLSKKARKGKKRKRLILGHIFRDEAAREATFGGFGNDQYTPEEFARGGFEQCDCDDTVICFSCHIQHDIDEVIGSPPSDARWHYADCRHALSFRSIPPRGQVSATLHPTNMGFEGQVTSDLQQVSNDGAVSDNAGNPPGQRSIYIPPGDWRAESYRLSTFERFPITDPNIRKNFAKNGFFFTGFSDQVKCFVCARSVSRWSNGDNPADHKWHKSSCLFMRGQPCDNIPIKTVFGNLAARYAPSETVGFRGGGGHFSQDLPERVGQAGAGVLISQTNGNLRQPELVRRPEIPTGIRDPPPRSTPQVPTTRNAVVNTPQPRAPAPTWRMANVASSDYKSFLTNLYLNRELDSGAESEPQNTVQTEANPVALDENSGAESEPQNTIQTEANQVALDENSGAESEPQSTIQTEANPLALDENSGAESEPQSTIQTEANPVALDENSGAESAPQNTIQTEANPVALDKNSGAKSEPQNTIQTEANSEATEEENKKSSQTYRVNEIERNVKGKMQEKNSFEAQCKDEAVDESTTGTSRKKKDLILHRKIQNDQTIQFGNQKRDGNFRSDGKVMPSCGLSYLVKSFVEDGAEVQKPKLPPDKEVFPSRVSIDRTLTTHTIEEPSMIKNMARPYVQQFRSDHFRPDEPAPPPMHIEKCVGCRSYVTGDHMCSKILKAFGIQYAESDIAN